MEKKVGKLVSCPHLIQREFLGYCAERGSPGRAQLTPSVGDRKSRETKADGVLGTELQRV